ncbi:MAG: hypothetical protein A2622_12380 [Bdellovibrionales bacterium RIFCSPHIGHO2_01_FULL_40_29]|nr:MAG: hypothetical protein A2622_12380 [Bdellovibrionales bacterium RIFCSPHIGHO2_01_FULL_40_29]OFZ32982.1 MAG: hypothetical protein A3D17_09690 [Bdellovibrionales bacterium RIFCSPHIGHO2_02_FULL_40_15]
MKKVDLFFVMVMFLFTGLATSYFAFDYHLSGVELEKQKTKALETQLVQMKLQNEALEIRLGQSAPSRQIASIQNSTKEISFDSFYRTQLQKAKNQQKAESILKVTKKILETSADTELLGEAYFEQALAHCHLTFKEDLCLIDIENVVSQFPESKWAGESLILLSSVYTKLKRFKEADSILQIVRAEFADEKSVMDKLELVRKKSN